MSDNITRLLAKILILRDRFYALTTRPWGRVGIISFVVLFAVLLVAYPALANDGTAGLNAFLLFIARFVYWIASLVTKLVVLVLGAVIEIMLYNSFSNNRVVSAGWAIVRDVVNMFFVVVLIVIAFGTIFGHQRFQWQQQVPKLMIFALVINFSKTLCGIMIDFAQVVMLTFANALREVAAGNFLQLLGLGDMWNISSTSPAIAGGSEYGNNDSELGNTFDYFAAGFAALVMVVMVLATIIILAAILMYRVVMLWIMIVLAPLAWFTGGLKGFIDTNAYAQWWDKFKCLVMVGPVLTFFLWLTLAVAGAGNIAASSGFDVSDSNNSGLIAAIFEMDKFMSFIIGLAMLYAGFDAAQQICSSMSGSFIGKRLKGGPTGAVKQAGGALVAGAALKVGAKTARGIGAGARWGFRNSATVGKLQSKMENSKFGAVRAMTKGGRAGIYKNLAGKMGDGAVGRQLNLMANRASSEAVAAKAGRVKAAGEKFKGDSRESKVDLLNRVASHKKGVEGMDGRNEVMHLLSEAMGDEKMQKQLTASGAMPKLWEKYGKDLEKNFAHDDSMTDKISSFKKKNAGMTGSAHLIQDLDDVKGLSDDSLQNEAVRKQLEKTKVTIGGESMTADKALSEGLLGSKKQDIYNGGQQARFDNMTAAELKHANAQTIAEGTDHKTQEKVVQQALESGDVGRASEVVAAITAAMNNSNLSDEQRFHASSALDNIEAMTSQTRQDEKASGHDRSQAETIGRQASEGTFYRDFAAQAAQARAESEGGSMPFGEVPAHEKSVASGKMANEQAGEAVAASLENASEGRLTNALDQIAERMEGANQALEAAMAGASPETEELTELNSSIEELALRIREDILAKNRDRMQGLQTYVEKGGARGLPVEKQQKELEQLQIKVEQEITTEIASNTDLSALKEQYSKVEERLGKEAAEAVKQATAPIQKEIKALETMRKSVQSIVDKRAGR